MFRIIFVYTFFHLCYCKNNTHVSDTGHVSVLRKNVKGTFVVGLDWQVIISHWITSGSLTTMNKCRGAGFFEGT
jgi:hypothetical protein